MPRVFWKGVIGFGLVAIPVRMYVATETRPLPFHLLHKKCLTRPKQVLHCEIDDEYFSLKETTRGYEYKKGEYVPLDNADLEKVPVKTAHHIEILAFVGTGEIDPIYYHASHYLVPDGPGARPFALLRKALLKTGRVGVARVTFQRREHLCCVRPLNDILVLHTMHYHDEIVPAVSPAPLEGEITTSELELAVSLIDTLVMPFRPEQYQDTYREALRKLIEAKLSGRKMAMPEAREFKAPDLMSALRASIEEALKKAEERQTAAPDKRK